MAYRQFAPEGANLAASVSFEQAMAYNRDFDLDNPAHRQELRALRPDHIEEPEWALEVAKLAIMWVITPPINRPHLVLGWKVGCGLIPDTSE